MKFVNLWWMSTLTAVQKTKTAVAVPNLTEGRKRKPFSQLGLNINAQLHLALFWLCRASLPKIFWRTPRMFLCALTTRAQISITNFFWQKTSEEHELSAVLTETRTRAFLQNC
uniref:Uncharacterized protein n=1 Tax=Rhodosorus marinus TaxID=101924 RepID=A0A7S2ZAL5_9RHOD